jgi:hypothetical protein
MSLYDYQVTFVGDYFTLSTAIPAGDEDEAVRFAGQNIEREYGWNVLDVSNETSVELMGEYL